MAAVSGPTHLSISIGAAISRWHGQRTKAPPSEGRNLSSNLWRCNMGLASFSEGLPRKSTSKITFNKWVSFFRDYHSSRTVADTATNFFLGCFAVSLISAIELLYSLPHPVLLPLLVMGERTI